MIQATNETVIVGNIAELSHDAFHRTTFMRQVVWVCADHCWNCQLMGRKMSVAGWYRMFRYGTQADGLSTRINWAKGLFCCVDCYRDYYSREH